MTAAQHDWQCARCGHWRAFGRTLNGVPHVTVRMLLCAGDCWGATPHVYKGKLKAGTEAAALLSSAKLRGGYYDR